MRMSQGQLPSMLAIADPRHGTSRHVRPSGCSDIVPWMRVARLLIVLNVGAEHFEKRFRKGNSGAASPCGRHQQSPIPETARTLS